MAGGTGAPGRRMGALNLLRFPFPRSGGLVLHLGHPDPRISKVAGFQRCPLNKQRLFPWERTRTGCFGSVLFQSEAFVHKSVQMGLRNLVFVLFVKRLLTSSWG